MTIGAGFKRAAPAAAKPAVRGPKRSRFAGVKTLEPRAEMPEVGIYRFRIDAAEEGFNQGTGNQSAKFSLTVVGVADGTHQVGDTVKFVELLTGKGGQFGVARLKGFVMTAAGYDDEAAYDEWDPNADFLEAVLGASNEFSERGCTIIGRLIDGEVKRGKDVINPQTGAATGDWYRIYTWMAVPEDEQEVGRPE